MQQRIKLSGRPLEFSSYGHGFPVLFFHGGHGNCREDLWHKGFDLRRYRLITPSRPGYGKTPLLPETSPETTAALFALLLEELAIAQCLVVGVSAGGPAAIAFAALFSEKCRGLILISAVMEPWLQPTDKTYQRALKLFSPRRQKWSWRAFRWFYRLAPRTAAKTMFKELSSYQRPEIFESEIAELRQMLFKQGSGAGFLQDLRQDPDPGLPALIDAPTLILYSHYDAVVNAQHPSGALQGIRNAQLHCFHNRWGHLLYLGAESEPVIEKVQLFCRRQLKAGILGPKV